MYQTVLIHCGLQLAYEQWGAVFISTNKNVKVTFPITFAVSAYAIALGNKGELNTEYAAAYSKLTSSSVYLADNDDIVTYMVIGC